MATHDESFNKMKSFFNSITRGNLNIILTLKDRLSETTTNTISNERLKAEIDAQNQLLQDPLIV